MKLYRFSPIRSEEELHEAIRYLHRVCHQLCKQTFGRYLPVAGNIGVFAHYEKEYAYLIELREQLTNAEKHFSHKYFELKEPIVVPKENETPGATYEYLYIRRVDPYRSQVGDVDFVLPATEHAAFKKTLQTGEFANGARIFERPDINMIELWNPDIDAASYVITSSMRDIVAGRASL